MDNIQHDYKVIFIDVGQGDATLIHQLSYMHSVLIDAAAGSPVLSTLRQTGELEAIFVTHWDRDHIGGMPAVINWLTGQRQKDVDVFINRQLAPSNIARRLRKALDEALQDGTIEIPPALTESPGQVEKVEKIGGNFFILWPSHEIGVLKPEDRNFDSLVLRFEVGAFSLLLGSDAKGDVWPRVDETALKADVLRYPHHGGKLFISKKSWSANDLISKVNPDWIVVSVGANNPHGHPSEEFIDALLRHPNIQVCYTTDGNINFQIESSTGNIRVEK